MSQHFDALTLVPRHISKFINKGKKAHQNGTSAASIKLAMDKPIGMAGTVGSDKDYNLYPDNQNKALVEALAQWQSLSTEQIFLGNGSDEVLDMLVRIFCMPGKDHAITFAPNAPRYEHFCAINGVHLHEVQLTADFQVPLYKTKTSYTEHTKMLFVSNPNPITGVALRNFDIVDILDSFEGIVVVDESLVEYSGEGSLVEFLHQYPKMVIVQSFSQAFGMAGLRLGVAYAHPSIIRILNAIRAPHNINVVAQTVALKAIENAHQRTSFITDTIRERERMRDALYQFKFVDEVEESQANFLLVRTSFPDDLVKLLAEEGVSVANVSNMPGCTGGVRINIGTAAQNEHLLRALREITVKISPARRFLRALSSTLKKASAFLGFFKKFMGGAS